MEVIEMRSYDSDFKVDAVRLANEIGITKASTELKIPSGTLDTWVRKAKEGLLKGTGTSPKSAISLAEEVKRLKQENRELKRANEILSKAAAFFALGQKK
jgi:transposase